MSVTQIRGSQILDGSIKSEDVDDALEKEFTKARVGPNDLTPDFLAAKLVAGTNITITVIGASGSAQTLRIAAASGGSSGGINVLHFGDGSDSSAVLDGTNSVSWATRTGNTYRMTRDALLEDLTIESGVTLQVANYMPFCRGTLVNSGTIEARGNDAAGTTPGAAILGGSWGSQGGAGGAGATGNAAGGNRGGTSLNVGNGAGGNGGGVTGYSGGLGGSLNLTNVASNSFYKNLAFLGIRRVSQGGSTSFFPINAHGGGGGGAARQNSGTAAGGGGGSSSSVLGVAANTLINLGTIRTLGGTGAAGVATGDGEAGGGGGGTGGPIWIYANTFDVTGTVEAVGGVGGTGAGGGSNGADGVGTTDAIFILRGT